MATPVVTVGCDQRFEDVSQFDGWFFGQAIVASVRESFAGQHTEVTMNNATVVECNTEVCNKSGS